jgi:sacsin
MYPEGSQQLNELIQNADDAKATVVKFVVSTKTYGTSSLLGQKMSEWQGGALYCYNDAVFTESAFRSLSEIGQASKLEKIMATGRFGLGFNSVFHWTDVPQIVSSDYLVMFDPHAKVRIFLFPSFSYSFNSVLLFS